MSNLDEIAEINENLCKLHDIFLTLKIVDVRNYKFAKNEDKYRETHFENYKNFQKANQEALRLLQLLEDVIEMNDSKYDDYTKKMLLKECIRIVKYIESVAKPLNTHFQSDVEYIRKVYGEDLALIYYRESVKAIYQLH